MAQVTNKTVRRSPTTSLVLAIKSPAGPLVYGPGTILLAGVVGSTAYGPGIQMAQTVNDKR